MNDRKRATMNRFYGFGRDGCYQLYAPWGKLLEVATGWGFRCSIEFPSDWHEERQGTIHFCLIWGDVFLRFPWPWTYEDHYQCEGPRFGFAFHHGCMWLYHGNSTGTHKDRSHTVIRMPWDWGASVRFEKVGAKETHDYHYQLTSGKIQERKATIQIEEREWRRLWWPWKRVWRGIDIRFSDEVGEETGSWKGGCIGCGYEMEPGETALNCLRRMERERKF